MRQKKWHSPQCKARSKTSHAGCWCHLIPEDRRKELDKTAQEGEQ